VSAHPLPESRRPSLTHLGSDRDVKLREIGCTAFLNVVHVYECSENSRPTRHLLVIKDVVVVHLIHVQSEMESDVKGVCC
jgi:hypothetical protein